MSDYEITQVDNQICTNLSNIRKFIKLKLWLYKNSPTSGLIGCQLSNDVRSDRPDGLCTLFCIHSDMEIS